MGRPSDWQPLADSDPVPGDPAGISSEAAHLSGVAQMIQGQVAQLHKIASGQADEHGCHAEKLKSAASDTAGQLAKVVGRYQKTAAALTAWVPDLEYAQSQSLRALSAAQDAAARQRSSQPVSRPPGTKLTPQDKQDDQARSKALAQANDDLAAARKMLQDATSYRDQKAGETKGKIDSAIHDGLKDSFWDDVGGFFSDAWGSFSHWVTEHAKIIAQIANIASWVATVCGILSLLVGWIPIVGQALAAVLDTVALLATIVALGCHLMLALTGNGSWADVALDAFALVTFGMGRAFGKAAEGGYDAARAASRGPFARTLGKAGQGLARSDVTAAANELTGFSAKEAGAVVTEAKNGLSLPSWGGAALHGLSPGTFAQDVAGSLKSIGNWEGTGVSVGEAGMHLASSEFSHVMETFPKAGNLPSVVRWTSIAHAAQTRFYISTAAGTGVDLFDKASTVAPHLPVLEQWNSFKELLNFGGGAGG